jgi:hypothetical protein
VKFTTLAANEDISALARRLYRPASAEAQRDAERTLLKANPHLAESAARVPGAVVIVPEVPGAAPSAEARSEGELLAPILQAARDRLGEVSEALRATIDSRRATVKATLDQIGSAQIQRLVREEPQLREVLTNVSNEAKTEAKEIEALERLQQQALIELGKDMDELLRTVGGQPEGGQPMTEQPVRERPPAAPVGARRVTSRSKRPR